MAKIMPTAISEGESTVRPKKTAMHVTRSSVIGMTAAICARARRMVSARQEIASFAAYTPCREHW